MLTVTFIDAFPRCLRVCVCVYLCLDTQDCICWIHGSNIASVRSCFEPSYPLPMSQPLPLSSTLTSTSTHQSLSRDRLLTHTHSRRWLLHFRHTSPHHSGRRALQAIRPRLPRVTLNCNTHTNAIIIQFFLSLSLSLSHCRISLTRAPMRWRSHSPL